ncbi:DUF3475 domain-containing protein [Heracleum sosnowskyi]|uniref:DUF3475 domain-containing protein n=1 Tax=Heracleum sosnowskyi TaxID=360622 RepID=A0AAD8MMT7_9APIA|nr:DUF3475 domain-containing protein [Heracleum sosnowskyi]
MTSCCETLVIFTICVSQVPEVGGILGRAGTVGLGKAVEVLDTLGSSMTNLNLSSNFVSGVSTKGREMAILSFEVANTIMKGAKLMQSLSEESFRQLKEVVLPAQGVHRLISKDTEELLRIVASDKSFTGVHVSDQWLQTQFTQLQLLNLKDKFVAVEK